MHILKFLAIGFFGLAVQAAVPLKDTAEAKLAQIKELLTPLLSENAIIIRDAGRLEKLQAIKTKFDPYNEFGFYASLASA